MRCLKTKDCMVISVQFDLEIWAKRDKHNNLGLFLINYGTKLKQWYRGLLVQVTLEKNRKGLPQAYFSRKALH